MTRIAFLTLGCKLNYAETSTYERNFIKAGLEVVPWQDKADVYVINTCTVTATSDSKSRNLVRKMHRVNPDAVIVVTGCSAELRRGDYDGLEGVARVFGASEKALVVPTTLAILESESKNSTAVETEELESRHQSRLNATGGAGMLRAATYGSKEPQGTLGAEPLIRVGPSRFELLTSCV